MLRFLKENSNCLSWKYSPGYQCLVVRRRIRLCILIFNMYQQQPQEWKRSVFVPIPKKGDAKECSNYCTIVLLSHANKIMLKILQTSLQQHLNWEVWDVQAGFRKGRGTRDQIISIHWIMEKTREYQKNIYFCFTDYIKAFDCGSQQNVKNS